MQTPENSSAKSSQIYSSHTQCTKAKTYTQCVVNVVRRVVPKQQMLRLWATQ